MTDDTAARHLTCSFCSGLEEVGYAMQKVAHEEDSTYLPDAAYRLTDITTIQKPGFPNLYLKQCPECKTYYLYRTYYEFLTNGSEDEEWLARLSDEVAADYLEGRRWAPLDSIKTVYEQ